MLLLLLCVFIALVIVSFVASLLPLVPVDADSDSQLSEVRDEDHCVA